MSPEVGDSVAAPVKRVKTSGIGGKTSGTIGIPPTGGAMNRFETPHNSLTENGIFSRVSLKLLPLSRAIRDAGDGNGPVNSTRFARGWGS